MGNDFGVMVLLHSENMLSCFVLNGATADRIYDAVATNDKNYENSDIKIMKAETLEEALKIAKDCAESGDIVSLCPACPAFDQFKTF